MKNTVMMLTVALAAVAASADPADARETFLKQQAYAEMQRVSGQVDVLQANLEDLAARVAKLEAARAENEALRAEIAALKATNADLRSRTQSLRDEIVREMSKKIADILRERERVAPTPPPPPPSPADAPHREYVVKAGDTLSLIAAAFNTRVAKIKEMNGLKSDNLRIGQKLILPL